ncbi:MAG: acetylxylan esterase [Blastocatellia bacterium]|nr:MAG: acetylxylan esterase [Blastocatellia bacterium]
MLRLCLFVCVFVCVAVGASVAQQLPPPNYDESKVGTYSLPDPLIFSNGTQVHTVADWNKRRAELLELFATNVYGHNPAPPKALHYEIFDRSTDALNGTAIRKQITIFFSSSKTGPKEDLLIFIPKNASKPVPVFLSLSFVGNQTAANDPAIKLGTVWNPRTRQKEVAPEQTRGSSMSETATVLAHGYAYATICYTDIEPDFNGGYVSGIRPLFFKNGQSEPAPDEWGAIGAWSYGLSRALDYMEKDKDVDAKRVAIIGHSRLGKTVLWTGALDQRFAMVISSCSGEGGASLSRRDYGERVRNLITNFPYWFSANYKKYADHEDQMPVDMHELIALIAPRPAYITAGETDRWADPNGEFLACVAAGPVFRLLGQADLGIDEMPALDQPIMKTIGFHIHTGGHAITPFDWEQFLKFADIHLRKREA